MSEVGGKAVAIREIDTGIECHNRTFIVPESEQTLTHQDAGELLNCALAGDAIDRGGIDRGIEFSRAFGRRIA